MNDFSIKNVDNWILIFIYFVFQFIKQVPSFFTLLFFNFLFCLTDSLLSGLLSAQNIYCGNENVWKIYIFFCFVCYWAEWGSLFGEIKRYLHGQIKRSAVMDGILVWLGIFQLRDTRIGMSVMFFIFTVKSFALIHSFKSLYCDCESSFMNFINFIVTVRSLRAQIWVFRATEIFSQLFLK